MTIDRLTEDYWIGRAVAYQHVARDAAEQARKAMNNAKQCEGGARLRLDNGDIDMVRRGPNTVSINTPGPFAIEPLGNVAVRLTMKDA